MANRPVEEIRFGSIKCSIWENESEHGTNYAATIVKVYKDGEEWKETRSFPRNELLVVSHVAQKAADWINAATHQEAQTA